jgi:hypothetical protein
MFQKSPDERLSEWANLRKKLDRVSDPLMVATTFWDAAPRVIHNHKIDPYNHKSWPTPWEIIVENRYDDFTLALMIGYTLKYTNKFENERIQVKTMVDCNKTKLYNLVFVNDCEVLNYCRDGVIKAQEIDESLYLENVVDIVFPR